MAAVAGRGQKLVAFDLLAYERAGSSSVVNRSISGSRPLKFHHFHYPPRLLVSRHLRQCFRGGS